MSNFTLEGMKNVQGALMKSAGLCLCVFGCFLRGCFWELSCVFVCLVIGHSMHPFCALCLHSCLDVTKISQFVLQKGVCVVKVLL